jgi:hypothetical protein
VSADHGDLRIESDAPLRMLGSKGVRQESEADIARLLADLHECKLVVFGSKSDERMSSRCLLLLATVGQCRSIASTNVYINDENLGFGDGQLPNLLSKFGGKEGGKLEFGCNDLGRSVSLKLLGSNLEQQVGL